MVRELIDVGVPLAKPTVTVWGVADEGAHVTAHQAALYVNCQSQ